MPVQTIYKPNLPMKYRISSYTLNTDKIGTEI